MNDAPVTIRILLVDDHQILREGLRLLLEQEQSFKVVAEAGTGREAISLAEQHQPEIIIMDISMPDLDGIEATRRILAASPQIRIIVLSTYAHRRFVVDLLQARVSGYLLKERAFKDLVHAIHTVMADEVFLCPAVSRVLVNDYKDRLAAGQSSSPQLSDRDLTILALLAEGKSHRQIAEHFNLSVKTIDLARRQIMEKLNLHSLADLIKFALREGLTDTDPYFTTPDDQPPKT